MAALICLYHLFHDFVMSHKVLFVCLGVGSLLQKALAHLHRGHLLHLLSLTCVLLPQNSSVCSVAHLWVTVVMLS